MRLKATGYSLSLSGICAEHCDEHILGCRSSSRRARDAGRLHSVRSKFETDQKTQSSTEEGGKLQTVIGGIVLGLIVGVVCQIIFGVGFFTVLIIITILGVISAFSEQQEVISAPTSQAITPARKPSEISAELRNRQAGISQMSGQQFEWFVADVFEALGYNVKPMGASGDQGVDVLLESEDETIAIQCKNYSKPVGNKPVQEIFSGSAYYGATEAWVVAPQGFTKGGFELAERLNVKLFDNFGISSWIDQLDITAESQQGKTDRENYTELLQTYRSYIDLMENLYEARTTGGGDPTVEEEFEVTRRELSNGMDQIQGKLDILERRNGGLHTNERRELEERRATEEARLFEGPPKTPDDNSKYLKLVEVYRGYVGVLEELGAAEAEHAPEIATSANLRNEYVNMRIDLEKRIKDVWRDLNVLESRTSDLPIEEREKLETMVEPLLGLSPPTQESESLTQEARDLPAPPEVLTQRTDPPPTSGPEFNIYEHIRKLAKLRDEGIISQEEFEMKKKDLLDRV